MFDLLKELRQNSTIENCYTAGEYHHLLAGRDFDAEVLKHELVTKCHTNVEIKPIVPDIEDVFIKLLSNEQK